MAVCDHTARIQSGSLLGMLFPRAPSPNLPPPAGCTFRRLSCGEHEQVQDLEQEGDTQEGDWEMRECSMPVDAASSMPLAESRMRPLQLESVRAFLEDQVGSSTVLLKRHRLTTTHIDRQEDSQYEATAYR